MKQIVCVTNGIQCPSDLNLDTVSAMRATGDEPQSRQLLGWLQVYDFSQMILHQHRCIHLPLPASPQEWGAVLQPRTMLVLAPLAGVWFLNTLGFGIGFWLPLYLGTHDAGTEGGSAAAAAAQAGGAGQPQPQHYDMGKVYLSVFYQNVVCMMSCNRCPNFLFGVY